MDLLELGTWGYRLGAVGILVFTLAFMVSVRWWSDLLGRVITAIFVIICAILLTGVYRTLSPGDSPGFLMWRAILYLTFGSAIWLGFMIFIWAQFFSPPRKEKGNAETTMAGSRPNRYGSSDDDSGGNGR